MSSVRLRFLGSPTHVSDGSWRVPGSQEPPKIVSRVMDVTITCGSCAVSLAWISCEKPLDS